MRLVDSAAVEPVEVVYPDSDGRPLADNEWQLDVILMLATRFRHHFADTPDVHVAADLLWYPIEGRPRICAAPDVMVIVGLGKERLRSYRPWVHGGRVTLVIEVLSDSNTAREMLDKLVFYDTHGAQEYLVFDPHSGALLVWERDRDHLVPVPCEDGWTSPSTQVSFHTAGLDLIASGPDGRPWALPEDECRRADQETARADQETARADQETARADQETARADQEAARAAREAARAAALQAELDGQRGGSQH